MSTTADPFTSILRRHPDSLETIRSAATTRRQPKEGDRRFFRGAWRVRRQIGVTAEGRAVFAWKREQQRQEGQP